MSWGFNDDNSLRAYINKVLAKDPDRDSKTTPAWMSGLNTLYREYPNVDNKYRDALLRDDVDVSKYNPLLEYMLEYSPEKLANESLYTSKYKGIPIDSVKERLDSILKERNNKLQQKENEDLEGYKDYLYKNMWKAYADKNRELLLSAPSGQIDYLRHKMKLRADALAGKTPRYFSFLDDIADEEPSPSLEEAYNLHKKWLGYKDAQAMNRGIKYPQLRFNNGDYVEDYLVDDYGNKIEDAFDNNIGWFRDKLGPELEVNSPLESKLKDVLAQNRTNLMQSNILKALAPDEEGGIF